MDQAVFLVTVQQVPVVVLVKIVLPVAEELMVEPSDDEQTERMHHTVIRLVFTQSVPVAAVAGSAVEPELQDHQ